MKKLVLLFISLIFFIFNSCKTGYDDEIFIEKYQVIYGKWEYLGSLGTAYIGLYKETADHTIKFIHYGKFRYNDGKTGTIKIASQDDNGLYLDFNSLFPNVSHAEIGFSKTSDTMYVSVINGLLRFYSRLE